VTLALDGEQAFAEWRQQRHELAVLDEQSSALGGLEVASRIKAETTGQAFTPVLIVARQSAEARVTALAIADDVVTRPYDPGELAARCAALLRTRRIVDELRAARAESEARSFADQVTGLRNRVFLGERLTEEWKRAARYNEPLSLILLSVEGLRATIEARGNTFGDRVLNAMANAALRSLRQIDIVTRFGPGELAALLPNTHFAGSLTCAERLHREVARSPVDDYLATVSMGISFYPSKEVNEPNDLIRLATRALDRAREEGPGNICLFQHQGYLFQPKKS
jgi:diguanylate cyclase (GGDEF)-like protein